MALILSVFFGRVILVLIDNASCTCFVQVHIIFIFSMHAGRMFRKCWYPSLRVYLPLSPSGIFLY